MVHYDGVSVNHDDMTVGDWRRESYAVGTKEVLGAT